MENMFVKNDVAGLFIALVLTSASYSIGFHFNWINNIGLLEAFAVITSYWCTYLCIVQTRFNYIIGVVSVIALGLLFYDQNLLASAELQLYLVGTLIYGWFRWRDDKNTRPVTQLNFDYMLLVYIFSAIVTYGVVLYINFKLGASATLIDTSIFVSSVVAQLLLDNKKLENWIVWAIVDIISVILYWSQDLKILAIQMGLFGVGAIWGYVAWYATMRKNHKIELANKYGEVTGV